MGKGPHCSSPPASAPSLYGNQMGLLVLKLLSLGLILNSFSDPEGKVLGRNELALWGGERM